MAITYPINLPTQPWPQVTLRARTATAVFRSPFTYQSQVQNFSGQLWEAQVSLPPMKRDEAEEWIAALLSLNGPVGTFLLGPWFETAPQGTVGAGPITVDGAGQTGQEIDLAGFGLTVTAALKAGDWLSIDSRLYKVLADVNSDGSGDLTADIWPALRASPSNGATVTTTSPKGLFRLATNQTEWSLDALSLYGVGFTAIESL